MNTENTTYPQPPDPVTRPEVPDTPNPVTPEPAPDPPERYPITDPIPGTDPNTEPVPVTDPVPSFPEPTPLAPDVVW